MRTLAGVRDVSGQRVQSVRTSGGFTNAAGYPEGQPRNTVNLAQKRKPTDKDKPAANAKRPRMMPTPYPPPRSDTAYPV